MISEEENSHTEIAERQTSVVEDEIEESDEEKEQLQKSKRKKNLSYDKIRTYESLIKPFYFSTYSSI